MTQKVYALTLFLTDGDMYEPHEDEETKFYATKELAIEAALNWVQKQCRKLCIVDRDEERLINDAKEYIFTDRGVDVSLIAERYRYLPNIAYLTIRESEVMQEPVFYEFDEEELEELEEFEDEES